MGERKALVVGIDEYPTCPLHGCCNDSEVIMEMEILIFQFGKRITLQQKEN